MKPFHIISSAILGTTVAVCVGLAIAQNQNMVQEAKAETIENFVSSSTITAAGTNGGSGGTASANKDGIIISSDGGYFTSSQWKIYSGKKLNISSSYTINKIDLTFSGSSYEGLNASYTIDDTSFSVTTTKQTRITSLAITYTAGGGGGSSNQIGVLYSKSDGASVSNIYGYYVGKLDDNNAVIMDGEYGIDVYKSGAFSSVSYTENETILKVTGSISIYNGLYEIKATSITTVASADISAPVVYTTQGGETKEYQNRVTTVTGVPSVTSGSLDNAAGTSDIKMNFSVNSKTINIHYKKARQTSDAVAALKTAVSGASEITISGFTGWYKKTDSDPGFQVQMVDIVTYDNSYTAEIFAQDLLDQTDAVCDGWTPGTNNHEALVAIWSDLASANKYPKLPSEQKTLLAEADVEGSSTIDRAMARYDFLTHKYGLNNFINGRLPSSSRYIPLIDNSNTTIFIVIISVISMSALSFGLFLTIRKRKHN